MANLGFVMITVFLVIKQFRADRKQYNLLLEFRATGGLTSLFEENCTKYELTEREIEFAILLKQGYTYRRISLKMFLSPRTVGNNIQALYTRLGVSGKMELIHKLWYE